MATKILSGALAGIVLWLIGNAFTGWLQGWFVFRPIRLPKGHPFSFTSPFQQLWLTRPDGARLHGLWFTQPQSQGLVLYFHGNKGHVGRWGHLYWMFRRWGWDMALFDYRGYGLSRGRRSEAAMLADALAMYDLLATHYTQRPIVLFGRSLGSAFASYVAMHRPAAGLILEAPFRSMPALFHSWWKLPAALFYFRYHFSNERYLAQVSTKVCIIHGTHDQLVPHAHGRVLAQLTSQSTFISIAEGGHHHLWFFDKYQVAVADFLLACTQTH